MKTFGSMVLVAILVNSIFTLPCVCATHEAISEVMSSNAHDCCKTTGPNNMVAVSSTPAPCNACGIVHRDASSACHGTKRQIAITEQPIRSDSAFVALEGTPTILSLSSLPLPSVFAEAPANIHPSAFSRVMRC